jgi:hypothetical protein
VDEAVSAIGRTLAIAFLAWLTPGLAGQTLHEVGKAFVWRINPSDYFFAEARFGRRFSHTNDVVFALTDSEGAPTHAVALVKKSNAFYTVSLYDFVDPRKRSADSEMRLRTAVIDAMIGAKIEAAVRHRLHGLVLLDAKPKNPGGHDFGSWWIFQRNRANKIETGLVFRNAGHANEQASGLLNGIIGNLERYVESSDDERAGYAAKLDTAATKIASGEVPELY